MSELPTDSEVEARENITGVQRAFLRWTILGAIIALAILPLLTTADVVGRYFLHRPLPGATELTEILMVIIIFLALPSVSRRHEHIVVDIFDMFTTKRVRSMQNVFAGVLGTVAMGLATWRLWAVAAHSARIGEYTAYLQIPMAPFVYFMTALCAIVTLAFLMTAVQALVFLRRGDVS